MARFQKVIPFLLRLGIGSLFLYAGVLKAADPAGFAEEINRYHLLPWGAVAAVALYLPWLEVICGGSLIIGKSKKAALWLLSVLMIVFLMALGTAWFRGLDIRCGCFGSTEAGSTVPLAILRDIGILGAIGYVLFRETITKNAS